MSFYSAFRFQPVDYNSYVITGFYCDEKGLNTTVDVCPGGYYCPLGTGISTSYPCPIGFFRSGASSESFADCTECTSGSFCDELGLESPKVSQDVAYVSSKVRHVLVQTRAQLWKWTRFCSSRRTNSQLLFVLLYCG